MLSLTWIWVQSLLPYIFHIFWRGSLFAAFFFLHLIPGNFSRSKPAVNHWRASVEKQWASERGSAMMDVVRDYCLAASSTVILCVRHYRVMCRGIATTFPLITLNDYGTVQHRAETALEQVLQLYAWWKCSITGDDAIFKSKSEGHEKLRYKLHSWSHQSITNQSINQCAFV